MQAEAIFLALLLAIGLSFFPGSALASSRAHTDAQVLEVHASLGTYFRNGGMVPLTITVRNNGNDFSGTIAASNPASPIWQDTFTTVSATIFQQSITVPHGTQKQVVMYLPVTSQSSTISISVELLDNRAKVIQSDYVSLNQLFSENVLVGLLSDRITGFEPLRTVVLPNSSGSVMIQSLNSQTMPSFAAALANFNLIVLDRFNSNSLKLEQLRALQLWVQQGGTLIEIGGKDWQRTMDSLPTALLPVNVLGTGLLPAGTNLLPAGITTTASPASPQPDTLQVPIIASTATVKDGARTILSSGALPLIVQAASGHGLVYYLAYDPTVDPLMKWPSTAVLWRGLIMRSLGDQLLTSGYPPNLNPGLPYYLAKLQHLLISNPTPTPWLLLSIFLSYLTVLGPVRWFIIQRTKQRQWNWRIVSSTILIFSLLSFTVALYQGQATYFSNSLSIIQLSQAGSTAHSSTYLGVYLPFASDDGTFQVQLPGDLPAQSFADVLLPQQQVTITSASNRTQVNASVPMIKSLDAFQVEQDISIHGGVNSHLVLGQRGLAGTVTNTLPTALSDVYLLMPHSIVRIGNLDPGQTSPVTLSLPMPSTSGGLPSCGSQIKQLVANDPGIITTYDHLFTRSVSQSVSERQRHLSLLAFILSASQCTNPSLGGAGSSATLIGWADHPLDGANNVTINGIRPGGIHETMLLADLNFSYAAGILTLPPDVLPGQLVDANGLGVRQLSPDSYAMSHAQTTFEYSLPASAHFHIQTMTFSQPADASISDYTHPGTSQANTSYAALYNWQTHSWDIIHLTQSVPFTPQNAKAYVSSDGRILMQYVNQAKDFSDVAFTKPLLTITGTALSCKDPALSC
jgi:hypothetical protein